MPAAAMKDIMEKMSPEEQKKSMDEWQKWMDDNKECFVDPGAPAGKNTRVTASGATEVSNEIGGYSIMQGESKEEVLEVLKTSPHIDTPGTYTEVMEFVDM